MKALFSRRCLNSRKNFLVGPIEHSVCTYIRNDTRNYRTSGSFKKTSGADIKYCESTLNNCWGSLIC